MSNREHREDTLPLASPDGPRTNLHPSLPRGGLYRQTKRDISNLRKQEVALVARYELCRERIKKLLLNRGFSPAAAADEMDHSPDDDNDDEPLKPRKVCRVGPAGLC